MQHSPGSQSRAANTSALDLVTVEMISVLVALAPLLTCTVSSPSELPVECQHFPEKAIRSTAVPHSGSAANVTACGGFSHSALTAINTGGIHTNVQKEGLSEGFLYLFPHHKQNGS